MPPTCETEPNEPMNPFGRDVQQAYDSKQQETVNTESELIYSFRESRKDILDGEGELRKQEAFERVVPPEQPVIIQEPVLTSQ